MHVSRGKELEVDYLHILDSDLHYCKLAFWLVDNASSIDCKVVKEVDLSHIESLRTAEAKELCGPFCLGSDTLIAAN